MKSMITGLSVLILTISAANAAVISKFDDKSDCTRFSMKHAQNGGKIKLNSGEKVHLEGTIYGFTFRDASVDFDDRSVSVRAEILKYGFNKDLRKKVILRSENVDVNKALKQLNRKVLTMDEVCINKDGELVDFVLPNS